MKQNDDEKNGEAMAPPSMRVVPHAVPFLRFVVCVRRVRSVRVVTRRGYFCSISRMPARNSSSTCSPVVPSA